VFEDGVSTQQSQGHSRMTEDLSEQQLQGLVGRAEVERETGFEPATFCLGSRHSAS
jgi:hypothetical protein